MAAIEERSPDGKWLVRWHEASQTDGVATGQPEILATEWESLLLDLRGTGLRGRIWWLDGGRFHLDLRRPPDRKELRLLVEPSQYWFRKLDLVEPGLWEPAEEAHRLSALTSYLAEHLEPRPGVAVPRGQYAMEELSPDGRTRLILDFQTGRMSHEIWVPSLYDAATGALLFRAPDDGYDGSVVWLEGGRLRLSLRHYWKAGNASVLIDPAAGTFRFDNPPKGTDEPLPTLAARLDEEFDRQDAAARGGAAPRPPAGPSQATLAARWILIFGGVAAFFAIIVGIAFAQGH